MLRSQAKLLLAGLLFFGALGSPSPASAGVWGEVGNAGDLPLTAQVPFGLVTLDAIEGELFTSLEKDMYLIGIVDPALFSATVLAVGSLTDSQLFLFDAGGHGVYANDDDGDPLSTLPAGHINGPPGVGLYYLAISGPPNDPMAGALEIFDDGNPGVQLPVVPGPVDGWTPTFSAAGGTYTIALTGAAPASAIPEPSAYLLFGLGALGLFVWRRRRAR